MGEGEILDLLNEFYVVKPGVSAEYMNKQLVAGKHLLITPGMYELSEPLHVTRPNTIILGIGWATLIPGEKNSDTAILVEDVDGVTIASLMFDAHYTSNTLIQLVRRKQLKDIHKIRFCSPTCFPDWRIPSGKGVRRPCS